MTQVIEDISRHRSVRDFTDESVTEEVLGQILEAAVRASTGGSMQLYSIIVTTDAERRAALAAVHMGVEAVRKAPVVLTFCVDQHRLSRWIRLHGESPGFDNMWGFGIGISDALLAAQNALLAAESLGLGGCFLGSTFIAAPSITRFFECPRGVVPVATLVLGHPLSVAELGTRIPIHGVTHRERYTEASDRDLEAMYEQHAKTTLERFCAIPYVGQAAKAAQIDHLSGYYARLQYPAELLRVASAYFASAIEQQGFASADEMARLPAVRSAMESAEIAALPAMRQLAFSMAIASGHIDRILHLPPAACEAEISRFFAGRDPALLDEVAQRGLFDPELRARLCRLLEEFGAQQTAQAAE